MSSSKPKLAFSLKAAKKKSTKTLSSLEEETPTVEGFEAIHDKKEEEPLVHPDLQGPLVIPALKDARQSLQEQARAKRQQGEEGEDGQDSKPEEAVKQESSLSKEDQEAIEALKREAGDSNDASSNGNKRVIQAQENTFQNSGEQKDSDQLKEDLERHAADLPVDSESYQKVPIADFGAALLRGMGWDGRSEATVADTSGLPRPSRLGLGATPKLLDAPTHRKGRRRQDQVQREQRLKEQQEEFQKQRELQIKKDKQQTIQVGSIVYHEQEGKGRAIIRQWNGVPGLNMILVQFEKSQQPTKVKKGSVQLVPRQELQERPFQELEYREQTETKYLGQQQPKSDRRNVKREDDQRRESDHQRRDDSRSRRRREDDHDNDDDDRRRRRDYDEDRRRGEKKRRHDDDRRRRDRSNDDRSDRDRRRSSSRRDEEDYDRRKRHKGGSNDDHDNSKREEKRSSFIQSSSFSQKKRPQTWLTPNIRVRVITSKFGRSHDKRKGVVVDVTTKGATLKMESGEILQVVPERYLETALPKVGGNAIILTPGNKHQFAKGRLLERDSKANKGAVQLFEDMNIVNTSLDDIAEWCLPLDDDLMD
mmetsp:Transcript_21825/g.53970  ORF Transcript_21825/g.53970 Transcript_21825/m.53970 type:complete len:592 (+) Transcript_21825:180-1955(+)